MIASVLVLAILVGAAWSGGAWPVVGQLAALTLSVVVLWRAQSAAAPGCDVGRTGIALLLLFIAVQALNPSHVVNAEDGSLDPRSHCAWLPHSVDASAALRALIACALAAAVFWLAACRVPPRRQIPLLVLLAVNGLGVALVGMLGRPVDAVGRSAMGPFVNENQFAAWLNLLTPVTLALGIEARGREHRRSSHPALLLFVAAACMFAGVAISESRAGLAVGAGQLAMWVLLEWRARHRALVFIVGAAIVALVAGLAGESILSRLDESRGAKLAISLQMRGDAVRGTLAMIADRPLLGVGAGGFARAFPYYQPASLGGFFRYAHNDWLQAVAELGAVGFLLLALAVADLLRPGLRRLRAVAADRLGRAVLLALGGLALHALVDFPMQIPAIALLAAVLAGVAVSRPAGSAVAAESQAG